MKVLLITPPQWTPFRPSLSLPSLATYLRKNGIDVVQKDFNIEAYDILLSKEYLDGLKSRISERFNDLDSQSSLEPGIEQEYYNDLFRAKSSLEYITSKVEDAKATFRGRQRYYNPNTLSDAREMLKQACAIISTAYFPTYFDLSWFHMPAFQGSFEDIQKLTQNRDENPFIELYEKHLLPFIREQAPDICGISVTGDSQLIPALTLARMIKSSPHPPHVAVGGYTITLLADAITQKGELFDTFFDSAILYEGERPILKLAQQLGTGGSLDEVPNLIYKRVGEVRSTKIQPPEDIDALPTPDFDGLNLKLYLSPSPVLPILASRGCYWGKCAFCAHNETYLWRYQKRKPEMVADDLQRLNEKYGAAEFAFSDEGIAPSSMDKICDEIINRKLNVRCSTNIRLEKQFTPELCKKMHEAGFRLLFLGLESGCDRVLQLMKKGTEKITAAQICKNVHEAGIWSHLYVFLGFPGETHDEAMETAEFLRANKSGIGSFNIDSFTLSKGSAVMKHPELFGVKAAKADADSSFELTTGYEVSMGISNEEAKVLSRSCENQITLETKAIMSKLSLDDLLNYLAKYGDSDPWLKSIPLTALKLPTTSNQLTRNSIPTVNELVVFSHTNFDIGQVAQSIATGLNDPVYPGFMASLYNPGNGTLVRLNSFTEQVLKLIDGQNKVKNIVNRLSDKSDRSAVERDCLTFLSYLVRENIISLSQPKA